MAQPEPPHPPPDAATHHPTTARPGRRRLATFGALALGGVVALGYQATAAPTPTTATVGASTATGSTQSVGEQAKAIVKEGRRVFRYATFGDEKFWGSTLQLHKAISGEKNGGVGPGVSPKTALAVGLKVDQKKLPDSVKKALAQGKVDLDDPATTLALLKLRAVVGVKGFFASDGTLRSVGIECALCHSTVDDSFAPGIGNRLDGWANRDLNVGAIVSLAPNLQPIADLLHTDVDTVKTVLGSWGPGRYDAALLLDGKAFRPDGKTSSVLLPPAFGLQGVNNHTSTGWGSVTYWNAFVANLQMHGQGNFYDPRLDNADQFPIAAENNFGHVTSKVDLISDKLPALAAYQLALVAPKAPDGSFSKKAAARGKTVFMGQAQCSTCHVPPTFTEPGYNMHPGSDIGIDDFQADRSPTHMYRTSPLKGLWTHQKGGFYHDGRFPDLLSVVDHYDDTFGLGLTSAQKSDLVQYLKSL